MEVGDGRSSSNDLSSAPPSDAEGTPGPVAHRSSGAVYRGMHGVPGTFGEHDHDAAAAASATFTGAAAAAGGAGVGGGARQDRGALLPPQPPKVRRPRKKQDADAPADKDKVKKTPGPRKSRGASTTAAATLSGARKKPKLEQTDDNGTLHGPRPPAATLQTSTLVQPVSFASDTHLGYRAPPPDARSGTTTSSALHDHTLNARLPGQPPRLQYTSPAPAAAAPRTTAMYDPIRAMTISRPLDPPAPTSTLLHPAHTPPRPLSNPRTSPAISGIIDPVPPPPPPPPYAASQPPPAAPSSHPVHLATAATAATAATTATASDVANGRLSAMDVDPAPPPSLEPVPSKRAANARKVASETPTRATSPKPARAKEQPPPPPGSGLLSASLFGGDSTNDATAKDSGKGPNIVLHIDLNDPGNRVINFARLAEEKYGFAALHPRQAAQKDRLARVAAAGAALERSASCSKFGGTSAGESGDEDLSVDIDRDSDGDGDVAMSGLNGGPDANHSGPDAAEPKRRRRRKMEEYNQDDPFIDDSELLWETQAAASKDGFFVYCGPLVPEGEKPAVERADGTIKRGRGRGRGGGAGSRGGRAAAAGGDGASGRGGGAGARGGVARKPRMTKAERAQTEKDKAAREKMAPIVAKPSAHAD